MGVVRDIITQINKGVSEMVRGNENDENSSGLGPGDLELLNSLNAATNTGVVSQLEENLSYVKEKPSRRVSNRAPVARPKPKEPAVTSRESKADSRESKADSREL